AGARLQLRVRIFFCDDRPLQSTAVSPPQLGPVCEGGRPVVVVGAGPAGLFCALRLAERGLRAVVLARGKDAPARRREKPTPHQQGLVDPESNYCFGEGGAGTYSDGKLYTRADKRGPVADVLRTLVSHGAPPDILIDARPHVGSNKLPKVVTELRKTLMAAG